MLGVTNILLCMPNQVGQHGPTLARVFSLKRVTLCYFVNMLEAFSVCSTCPPQLLLLSPFDCQCAMLSLQLFVCLEWLLTTNTTRFLVSARVLACSMQSWAATQFAAVAALALCSLWPGLSMNGRMQLLSSRKLLCSLVRVRLAGVPMLSPACRVEGVEDPSGLVSSSTWLLQQFASI